MTACQKRAARPARRRTVLQQLRQPDRRRGVRRVRGRADPPGARFCNECGAAQGAAPRPAVVEHPVASRRVTSVLFGDLVGFTTLSEKRDQEEVRELLSRVLRRVPPRSSAATAARSRSSSATP